MELDGDVRVTLLCLSSRGIIPDPRGDYLGVTADPDGALSTARRRSSLRMLIRDLLVFI